MAIFVTIFIIASLGCTETNTDSKNNVSSEVIQTGETGAEVKGETTQLDHAANLSDEVEWEGNFRNGCHLLAADYQSISEAANNTDYVVLEKAANKLEADAHMKLEESQKYQLSSSTRQYGKSEYEAFLEQFIQVGKYYSSAARKAQEGDSTGAIVDIQTSMSCQKIAMEHLQNINTYYNNQISTDSAQTETESGFIVGWTGDSIKDTETFHVSSDEWKLTWDTKPGEYGPMNFQIYVYNSDGTLKSVAANVIGESLDYSIIRGSGDYYLSINTAQPYTIGVWNL